jgi:MipA family protein
MGIVIDSALLAALAVSPATPVATPPETGTALEVSITAPATEQQAPAQTPASRPAGPALGFGPFPPGWQIDFGPGLLAVPEFPGSRGLRILPIPQLDIRYKNQFFASVQTGIGYNLINTRKFRAGPILRPEFGRTTRDIAVFPGLQRIRFTVEAGGFVAYQPSLFTTVQLEVRQAVSGHNGLLADLSLRRIALLGKWTIGYGGRVRFANAVYFRNYYGVTPAASLTSGLAAYRPGSGVNDVGVSGFVSRRLSPKWNATLFASYNRLVDQAAASPITTSRFGSRNQVSVGAAVSYRFRFN